MKNNLIKIFLILFCVICTRAKAQYADEIQFSSIDYFLMNRILFKDVYSHNTEIMKANIKKVKVKDENNNLLSETFIDIEGRVSGHKKYTAGSSIPDVNIKAEYDARNNLVNIYHLLPDGTISDDIKLRYIGNKFILYDYFSKGNELFEQCEFRYDMEDKNFITGFDSHLWQGDSIPYSVNFKYDEYGRLNDIRVVSDIEAIYRITYSGDTIKIVHGNRSGYETYLVKENIIQKYIVYSEELSFTGERTFSYDENGLVNYILIEDSRGNKYRQNFEYDYYH
jgi:hypothetical protein